MLELRLLGNFNLMYNGRAVDTLHDSPRLQTLLAYLVLHCDAPQPRRQIAYLFWPESTEKQARTNLRKLLLQLRRALPATDDFLTDTQQTIQWQPNGPFWVDVAEVRELLDKLQNDPENLARLTNLNELYTGELLPNCYDEWVLTLRRHLHEAVTHALGRLVAILEERHAYAEGIRYAQRLLHLDPLGEENYLRLIRLRAFAGDRTGALQTYHDCVATLRAEVDVEPADAIQTLAKQLQAGLPLQGTSTPPPEKFATNAQIAKAETPQAEIRGLPTPTTPCIGRAKELADLVEQLARPYCRLLTLYGPGGMGKTRLALALAEAQQHAYRHGICFVSLASLSTPENIAPAIAGLLGLHLVEGRRPETQLLAHLRDQQILLILDNVEHLLTAEPSTVGGPRAGNRTDEFSPRPGLETHLLIEQLLHAAPALKILITSREPLDLYEEHTYEVQGLSVYASMVAQPIDPTLATIPVPSPKDEEQTQPAGAEALSAAEMLFYHQLARVRPELRFAQLSAADRAAVTAVCRLVEGMPLALELAATQLRTVTLPQLIAGLQQNLDLLKVRWRGAHRRHQSMRAVIDASVQTVGEAEQLYLARLALFQGGFSAASAQAVAGASPDGLDTLLHKSLLRRSGDYAGEPRFDLHTLIRQYAAEALAMLPAEEMQTAARYCRYYADLVRDGMAQWRATAYTPTALVPLAQEIDNLSAVARRLIDHGTIPQRQAFLQELWDLYRVERRLPEIMELLHEAIAVTAETDAAVNTTALAQWHRMLGEAYHILGEFEESRHHFEETLRVLAFPVAGGGIELLTTLQRQGLQQVLQRLGALNLFRRAAAAQGPTPGLLDAIEAYRQLVDISLFSGDLIRLANSALYALNLAERTADPPARALTYSLMCLMTSAVPGIKLGKRYEELALAQLPLVQAPERQIDIAIYLGAYYAGQGNWSSLDAIMRPAIEKSRALHAHRRWGYCQAIWASTFLYRGQFVDGLQAWRTLYEQSLASDSFLFILPAWAAGGMALCNVRLGAWHHAIERAEAGLAHLQGKDDAIGRARCLVAIALARLQREEHQPALNAADHATALLRNTRPTNYAALECYTWAAEVYLALWQWSIKPPTAAAPAGLPPLRDETDQPMTAKQLQAKAYNACKALDKYTHIFPIGRASAALLQGEYARLDGRQADAFVAWQRCIEVASAVGMPYETGCAHRQLGHYLPTADPHRVHHRHRAEAIFATLNLVHDLPRTATGS
jgi:predicted ATPase/DNA-binding SARP family transcriptional activator